MTEKRGRVPRRRERRGRRHERGVEGVGEAIRRDAQVDLERRVRPLHRGVVRHDLERIVPVDRDAERRVAHAPQALGERPVARQVGDRAGSEVLATERRQDSDGDGPCAVCGGGVVDVGALPADRAFERREGASGEGDRVGGELDLEAVQLGRDARALDVAQDLRGDRKRLRGGVDQEQLELRSDARLSHPESGSSHQLLECGQLLAEAALEAGEVLVDEVGLLDLGAHVVGRAYRPRDTSNSPLVATTVDVLAGPGTSAQIHTGVLASWPPRTSRWPTPHRTPRCTMTSVCSGGSWGM